MHYLWVSYLKKDLKKLKDISPKWDLCLMFFDNIIEKMLLILDW